MKSPNLTTVSVALLVLSCSPSPELDSASSDQRVIEDILPLPLQTAPRYPFTPEGGFVPDKITAVRIAEAVLIPVYGAERLESEKPFRASLKGDVWIVTGTVPPEADGGTAFVELSRHDGRILYMTHHQ